MSLAGAASKRGRFWGANQNSRRAGWQWSVRSGRERDAPGGAIVGIIMDAALRGREPHREYDLAVLSNCRLPRRVWSRVCSDRVLDDGS